MHKKITLIVCLLLTLFSLVLVSGCGENDKYVQIISEGSMDIVPNVKIGKAFEKFFDDGKWKSFESKDKERVVEFNGKCTWNNKPATCMVQFIIHDNNRFEMHTVAINDVNMNRVDSIGILRKALEGK